MSTRNEAVWDGSLPSDYPVPFLTWSEIQDSLTRTTTIDLGFSTSGETTPLADAFQSNQRFAGRLDTFIDSLYDSASKGFQQRIITRQRPRLEELWRDRIHLVEGDHPSTRIQRGQPALRVHPDPRGRQTGHPLHR